MLEGAIVSSTVTAIALSNHTDNRTIKGRRFVVTILRIAASASIAGEVPIFIAARNIETRNAEL